MLSQIDKQVFKSWVQYAVEPRIAKVTGRQLRQTGPRIAVIGNCQAFGVAYAMKVMDPSATVHHYTAIGHARVVDMSLLVKTLDTYDYVFSHDFLPGHLRGPGGSDELRDALPRKITRLPAVTYAAFHPDLVYLTDASNPNDGFIFGPLGPYHSAIAVFAYRAGLSVDETRAMFNENVFATLGYLDMWNEAARGFLETAQRDCGLDLSTDLMKWSRRGVFMYSLVHPMHFVLFDISRRIWEKVGLTPPPTDFSYYNIHDLARAEIFPVYPPIAKLFGVQGGYLFKLQNHHLANDVGDFLTLPQYLSACFKTYEKAGAENLGNPRVEGWLADDSVKSLLVGLARENLKAGKLPTI
jgi:Polysaccharide biosynthesis enzyme WcbI